MGTVFREWYGQVSQLRSLVATGTPIIALIATATVSMRNNISLVPRLPTFFGGYAKKAESLVSKVT